MNCLHLDDDIFSPVRFDITTGENSDSSEGSLNDHSNADEFLITDSVKNKVTKEKRVMKSVEKNELESKAKSIKSKSAKTCSPVLDKNSRDKSNYVRSQNSSDYVNAKSHFSKLKSEKIKDHKSAAVRIEKSECQQKKQELLYRENILDSNTPKFNASDEVHQKKSRPTSLLLKDESTKQNSLKNIKKKQKAANQSSKGSYGIAVDVDGVQKSKMQLPSEKKMTSSSSNSIESSDIKLEDSSVMSIKSMENVSSLENENCGSVNEEIEKLNINPLHASYEATIKKMIRNSISSEWTSIRQLMYMQQISFYRELNKIKDEIEKQHLATTERLYKVIEELMRMNASLRALSNTE